MMKEGEGRVPPAPVEIRLTAGDVEYLRVQAERRNQFRGYAASGEPWKMGFIKDPIFVGLCGEHALCVHLNRAAGCYVFVDTSLRLDGDGGCDVRTDGFVIQVKTRSSGEENLVRRVDAKKRLRSFECDFFVFASWHAQENAVRLLGWIRPLEAIEVSAHQRSRVADHFNLSIPPEFLEPMNRLVDEILLRRELRRAR